MLRVTQKEPRPGGRLRGCACLLLLAALLWPVFAAAQERIRVFSAKTGGYVMRDKVVKSAEEWRQLLTPQQYEILREKGTERAWSHPLHDAHGAGLYQCAGCGLDLFRAQDKFDSGTGWPSFTAPIAAENVRLQPDNSFLSQRTEVLCARCDGHLGHVFDDGPPPAHKRYCMNGTALVFVAQH